MAAISESRSWCTETEDNVIFWQRTRDSLVEMTLSIQAVGACVACKERYKGDSKADKDQTKL